MVTKEPGAAASWFLIAFIGLILFIFASNTFDFKDRIFTKIFPKNPSEAADNLPDITKQPSVQITNPVNESSVAVNEKITIQAQAYDDVEIKKVEFYINESLKCIVVASPYICSWMPGKDKTSYIIAAKAYDDIGNIALASVKVTSVE